jgi:hypothetical protein
MQYLFLCCCNEQAWFDLPAEKRDAIMQEYGQMVRSLKQSGKLLSGAKLDTVAAAATIRQRDGKPVVIDGPFAETKEQLGGYHVIECRDRDEAIALARRFPTLPIGGTIEVRPVLETE